MLDTNTKRRIDTARNILNNQQSKISNQKSAVILCKILFPAL
jgi:hypothetical protein